MEKLLQKMFNTTEYDVYQIQDLALALKEYYELDDYIKYIKFRSIDGDGMYSADGKLLILDFDQILQSAYCSFRLYNDDYKLKLERLYLISIIITLFHEINHARQAKAADEDCDDTLHKVIKEGMELGRRSPDGLSSDEKRLYKYYYEKVLTERQATIMAYHMLYKFNDLNLLSSGEFDLITDKLNEKLNKGYYLYKNPCSTYYALRGKKNEYKELDFNDVDYDLLTKLSWGFPVNKEIIKTKDKVKML